MTAMLSYKIQSVQRFLADNVIKFLLLWLRDLKAYQRSRRDVEDHLMRTYKRVSELWGKQFTDDLGSVGFWL